MGPKNLWLDNILFPNFFLSLKTFVPRTNVELTYVSRKIVLRDYHRVSLVWVPNFRHLVPSPLCKVRLGFLLVVVDSCYIAKVTPIFLALVWSLTKIRWGKVDVVFLQSGRGFLAKWTWFSCKVDVVFLRIAKVKSTPSPSD